MKVPKGIDLTLSVYPNAFNSGCDDPIFKRNIPALSQLYDAGNIIIEQSALIRITGKVLDCKF